MPGTVLNALCILPHSILTTQDEQVTEQGFESQLFEAAAYALIHNTFLPLTKVRWKYHPHYRKCHLGEWVYTRSRVDGCSHQAQAVLEYSRLQPNCFMNLPAWLKTMANTCVLCTVHFWAVRVGLDQVHVLGFSFQTHTNHIGEKWAVCGERTGLLAQWRFSPREESTSSKGRLSPQHLLSSKGSSI